MESRPTRREIFRFGAAVLATPFLPRLGTRPQQGASGQVTTLAGNGTAGNIADGDLLDGAAISSPFDMAVGPDGALYWCEMRTGRVIRLDQDSRRVGVVAGNGTTGYSGDGGPARSAQMGQPHELVFDTSGDLYVVERFNHVVRRIDMQSGTITTVAGIGTNGYGGDGGAASEALFAEPHGIALDRTDNLYICDIFNHRIRRVDAATRIVTTFAGNGETGSLPREGALTGVSLPGPRSIDIAPDGTMYVVLRDGNAVFALHPVEGRVERIAGTGQIGYAGDGGPALSARFGSDDFSPEVAGPKGITYSPEPALYVADSENHVIRKIDLEAGTISTVVGNGEQGDGPDGDPLNCRLNRPHGILFHEETLYIADSDNHRIRTLRQPG